MTTFLQQAIPVIETKTDDPLIVMQDWSVDVEYAEGHYRWKKYFLTRAENMARASDKAVAAAREMGLDVTQVVEVSLSLRKIIL